MKLGISIKLDVNKIVKDRLFKGEKGTYLDLTTFIDTESEDQYGNHGFIAQSTTKEEQGLKYKTPILGNTKVFYKSESQQGQDDRPRFPGDAKNDSPDIDEEEIPF